MGFSTFNQLPLYTDDFFLCDLNRLNTKDTLVIFNPADSIIISPVFLRSRRTLGEHIAYILDNDFKKVIVVGEDIRFLRECPNLEYLKVLPSISAVDFDYAPIYDLPKIKWLCCETQYGAKEELVAIIDYSRFTSLKTLYISGPKGHMNVQAAEGVRTLSFDFGYPNAKDLIGTFPGSALLSFSVSQAPIQSMKGIEAACQLRRLQLSYNRKLKDISDLRCLRDTLGYLEIDMCGNICDFSVLGELHNLEYLILKGSNVLPDLSFLKGLKKLKYLHLTMNVEDGDLSLCEGLPYARVNNRKHYSCKDKDLPKDFTDPEIAYPFEYS